MSRDIYEVHQIDKSCWRIEEEFVRAFLVTGSEKAMLVDSGFGSGNIKEIVSSITNLPIMLVNTHADRDQVGCNSLFGSVHMHPSEYDRYSQFAEAGFQIEPLWEGDEIDLGGRNLEVLHIPGHTPGSIALLDCENRVLFSGDSIQAGTVYMFGMGRNIHAYIESLKKLAAKSGLFDVVYPSHGPIPLSSKIIDELIIGANRVFNKEIEGLKSRNVDITALKYDTGAAKFLY